MTNIVVISAGISVPSSTRILADALGKATARALSVVEPASFPSVVEPASAASGVETQGALASYDVIELRELAHLLTDNVLTGFPTGPLADAVRRVHAGLRVVDPTLAAQSLTDGANPLSVREVEVLRVALEGAPVAVIAARVHLSPGTVRNYLSSAIGKTGTGTRVEAARSARDMDNSSLDAAIISLGLDLVRWTRSAE